MIDRRLLLRALICGASLLSFGVGAAEPASGEDSRVISADKVDVIWGGKIPTRDGKKLGVTVYRPHGAGPLPVIFMPTPYIGDTYHERAMYFARRGYVFALVDVRGRGNSDADFEPFIHDAEDGYDEVEWLASQPWSNGKVGMWGGSYGGYVQWATAKMRPPHLKTIVPVASVHPGVDYPYHQNRIGTYTMQWLTYTSGHTLNTNLFGAGEVFAGVFRRMYSEHRPFGTLDTEMGNPSKAFQLWIAHPEVDAFWDSLTPTKEQYAAIDLPILTVTGYYDGDQLGALGYYHKHMAAASAEARARHYFIIGPWDHAGTRTPKRQTGGVEFGEKAALDIEKVHWQWYDWTLKDGPKPEFLKARVAYYLPGYGSDEWKYADSLETVATGTKTLYLSSNGGRANDVFNSGDLAEGKPSRGSAPDRWVYDPLDTRPALDPEPKEGFLPSNLDQSEALNLYGAGLVYHSAPFKTATEITGQIEARIYLSMDVPDTDLSVSVYEILPTGTSIMLTDTALRARYRESLRTAKPVPANQVVAYDFKDFMYISRLIAPGSRLRFVIHSPNTMHSEKNYNSGGVVAQETAKDARTAHIALYHDAQHPSYLKLPIVGAGADAP